MDFILNWPNNNSISPRVILAVTRAYGAILANDSTFVVFDSDNPITENDA